MKDDSAYIYVNPSEGDSKPQYYTELLFDLISSYDDRKYLNPIARLREFLSLAASLATSKARMEILIHFIKNRADSEPVIASRMDFSDVTVFRELRKLEELGIIEKAIPSKTKACKGRPPSIWGLVGHHDQDDLIKAVERDRIRRLPIYSEVERIEQLILNDYIKVKEIEEISYTEIIRETKAYSRGFYSHDIADLVSINLHQNHGIKVWR